MSAMQIAAALGAAYRAGSWWRCRCPVHQSTGPTLALRDGAPGLIVHCHAGCHSDDLLRELRRLGLLDVDAVGDRFDPAEAERQREADARRRQQRVSEALDYWHHETVPAQGTIVERYWAARGLTDLPIPPTIRASRSWLPHAEGRRPALIALVEHLEHGPVAIHRTWLAIDGSQKASFRNPKMSLGPVGGAAVRLAHAPERDPLIVAEGIETAASVMLATGYPAWAAISAGGVERLILPPLPIAPQVIIAADHDDNCVGERAARAAARRWLAEGRRVRIALPPEAGTDWNDELNKGGRNAA